MIARAMPTSVLIVDDHEVVRQGLRAVIEDAEGFVVAGEAGDAAEALKRAAAVDPDLAVVDLSLPGMSGLQLMREMNDLFPRTRCLVLSMHADEAYLIEAVRIGAKGYIVKGAPSAEIVQGLKAVSQGRTFFSAALPAEAIAAATGQPRPAKNAFASLSAREVEVLGHIADGLTSKQIGERMGIGARTVESHRLHILRKLGLKSSSDLVAYALDHRLLAQKS